MATPSATPLQLDPLSKRNLALAEQPAGGCGCGCGCQCSVPAPSTPQCATRPVRYASGEIVLFAKDLDADGFGFPWGHTRSFASRLSQNTNVGNGYNWQIQEWPYLVIQANSVVVMGQATMEKWFTKVGNSYVPSFSSRETLIFNSSSNVYQLIDLSGGVTTYSATSGVFQSFSDPAGNTIQVVSYVTNGFNFSEVQRSFTSGGTTTTESFLYTYVDSTVPSPVLANVTLRRKVGAGAWTNVTQAVYTYYSAKSPCVIQLHGQRDVWLRVYGLEVGK